ncbi:MAG: hypothetical protein BWY63_02595 [Chloroflexi bacterium ADurb.Bin360]|nr:MAG: hypothetical protein BWY63_02595 [Chloroflexi bacterium ADurb.Bin360]
MAPLQCQQVVDGKPGTIRPFARKIALISCQQEAQRVNQTGTFFHQALALLDGSEGEPQFAFLEIADAAMNQFRGAAGGAPTEVSLLNEQRLETQASSFAQNPGAGNPATDDDDIPRLV